ALDGATVAPATGVWLITASAGTVALVEVVIVPTVRPAPVIVACAAVCIVPTTLGTVTSAGPSDTVNATAVFGGTAAPTLGLWLITCPPGAAEFAVLIVPTVRPAPTIAVCAAVCVSPITAGTVAMFRTVTGTGADVAVLPAASRATAVSVWAPSVTSDVCQEIWNGAVSTSDPIGAPPSRNVTPATPTLSDADAVRSTLLATTAPLAGALMVTVGDATSAVTVTETMPIAVWPAMSTIS